MHQVHFPGMNIIQCADFLDSLALLVEAGVPVVRAVNDLARTARGREARKWAERIGEQLRKGQSLATAFNEAPEHLMPHHIAMIEAGANFGEAHAALNECARELRTEYERQRRLFRGLLPPLILLHLAIVLPSLPTLFSSSGAVFLREVTSQILVIDGVLFGLIVFVRLARNAALLGIAIDSLQLSIPVFGRAIANIEHARFLKALGSLYRAGIPLPRAFQFAGSTYRNRVLRRAAEKAYPMIAGGAALDLALARFPALPPFVEQIVSVHREAGKLDHGLLTASNRMQEEGEQSLERAIAAIPKVVYFFALIYAGYRVIQLWLGYMSQVDQFLDGLVHRGGIGRC
jgi:type IV pilus assembly protein PilC